MSFRRATFPEVLDHLLTSVTGGVAGETHPFLPDSGGGGLRLHLLRPPAAQIVSVYGSRGGRPHQFRGPDAAGEGGDYALSPDGRSVVWRSSGELPDAGSLLSLSYRPAAPPLPVDDIRPGSVLHTLCSAAALEMARLDAQLEVVHDAGFVDTASGSALEKVIALVGVERLPAGLPSGEIELRRVRGGGGAIFVPIGTRVMTGDGAIEYATTADATLAEGQSAVRVTVRGLEPGEPLPAGALQVLPVPIAGLAEVSNPQPTTVGEGPQSDDELRRLAKRALAGSARATVAGLEEAAARQGIRVEIDEPADRPGVVAVTPRSGRLDPAVRQRLLQALEAARPAGVKLLLLASQEPRAVDLELLLRTAEGLLEAQVEAAHRAVRQRLATFFDLLPQAGGASLQRLAGEVLAVDGVEDFRLLAASWQVEGVRQSLTVTTGELPLAGFATRLGELTLADPALATRIELVVRFPSAGPAPDRAVLRTAFGAALSLLSARNAAPLPASPDPAEEQRRSLIYRQLLHVLPLAGRSPGSLDEFDPPDPPQAPRAADFAPLEISFAVLRSTGAAERLAADDDVLQLTPFERLDVGDVVLQELGDGS